MSVKFCAHSHALQIGMGDFSLVRQLSRMLGVKHCGLITK